MNSTIKYYHAIFKKTDEGIEVEFPELKGCVTCGENMHDAFEMAEDLLQEYLYCSFIEHPGKKLSFDDIKKLENENVIVQLIKIRSEWTNF